MSIDLSQLNSRELDSLIRTAQARRKVLVERPPAEKVRRQLIAAARQAGYTIAEVFGADAEQTAGKPQARRRKLPKVAPKYRDPENRRNTWTGRGKMPRWLASKLRFGRTVTDFLIPGVARLTPKDPVVAGKRKLFKQG